MGRVGYHPVSCFVVVVVVVVVFAWGGMGEKGLVASKPEGSQVGSRRYFRLGAPTTTTIHADLATCKAEDPPNRSEPRTAFCARLCEMDGFVFFVEYPFLAGFEREPKGKPELGGFPFCQNTLPGIFGHHLVCVCAGARQFWF